MGVARAWSKFRLRSLKRVVQIVPISFDLVKKRVETWVILLSCIMHILRRWQALWAVKKEEKSPISKNPKDLDSAYICF